MNGRLYMRQYGHPGYYCSATSVTSHRRFPADGPYSTRAGNRSLVITAGHCIHSGKLGEPFFDQIVFAPGYHDKLGDGKPPYIAYPGKWSVRRNGTHVSGWRTKYPNAGGDYGNLRYDFAFLRVVGKTINNRRKKLHDLIPFASINFNYDPRYVYVNYVPSARQWWIHGYPAQATGDANFDGTKLWRCSSTYWRADPDVQGSPRPFSVSCAMYKGASGGGWFSPWYSDRRPTLLTVSSTSDGQPDVDGDGSYHNNEVTGPYFSNRARDLWRYVRVLYE
jgi:hypothetical protein